MSDRGCGTRQRLRAAACGCVLVAMPAACAGPPESEGTAAAVDGPWLVDEAEARGVRFVLESGAIGRWAIPEIVSGGVALFDLEGDGDLDLYFVQSGPFDGEADRPPNRLFENLGSGRFRDATEGSGAGHRGWGMGVATGDANNDGWVDLYVTNLGPNALLLNRGDGTFEDVTEAAGVGDPGFSSSAAFFDYDLDGDLDLVALNYLRWSLETEQTCWDSLGRRDYCKPTVYQAPAANRLYRNRGDGTFEDVSSAAGLANALGTSLGVVAGDFTGDRLPDFFVANDAMMDRLWVGSGDGRFTDEAVPRACAVDGSGQPKAGMGVAAADLDDDGDLDLLVGNLGGETDSLFLNQDGRFFVEATARYGLAAASRGVTRFGLGFADFDNDGRLDLLEVAGRVFTPDPISGFSEPNLLLRHLPAGRFVLVEGGLAEASAPRTSRGAALGDIDGDGWIDAIVVNREAPAELLINQRPGTGQSLLVRALDRHGRPALGATIRVEIAGRIVHREVRSASGYLSAHDDRVRLTFLPGQRPATITVSWLGGADEVFPIPAAGNHLAVRESDAPSR